MNSKRDPFNVKLLRLDSGQIRLLTPISSLDRFDGAGSVNFHPEGLFSTEIFGRVGDDKRDNTFSYIPLKTTILHPIIFQQLGRLKRLYTGILSGKEYAIWDDKLKDFVSSNETEGETGYQFFISHWDDIVISKGNSEIRKQRIELINKFRNESLIDNVLVMPAGLRDAEIDNLGRTREDEINGHYMKLLSITNTIGKSTKNDSEVLNTARYSQQMAFNEIYKTIENLLTGKKGFIQGKWGSRNIVDGTRNVISAMDISTPSLDSTNYPGPDDTVLGLWQVSRGALPITIAKLKSGVLSKVFGDVEGNVRLIDTKTLESEFIQASPSTYDRWTTNEGLEKVIATQKMVKLRAKPVIIEDRYLALVYKPKNEMVFKVFLDINELPEGASKKDVYPLTYEELIYLSNYKHWNDLRVVSTRYPVTGEGSSYTSRVFIRTTIEYESRVELDDDWKPIEDGSIASVYPVFEPEAYIDSSMVHLYRLAGLGADFDGDMVSNNIIYTQEAISEIDEYLNSPMAHVDPAGGMRSSAAIDTTNMVMFNLTGP